MSAALFVLANRHGLANTLKLGIIDDFGELGRAEGGLVAGKKRRHSGRHRFSDTSIHHDAQLYRGYTIGKPPSSPGFARQIKHCRHCGSRIVSNARKCPYCGKSVTPFFMNLAFWVVIIAILAVATAFIVIRYQPQTPAANHPAAVKPPTVVGVLDPNNLTDLPVPTTVDSNDLLITVIDVEQSGTTANGTPIIKATVQFVNKGSDSRSLFSTSWLMQQSDGQQAECYIGKDADGNDISSGIEGQTLAPSDQLTTELYFSGTDLTRVIYLVDPLNADNGQVTWLTTLPSASG